MGPAGKITGLGGGGVVAGTDDSRRFHAFAAQVFEKFFTASVIADDSHRQDARTERSKVVDGIRAATGIYLGVAMAQDQHRSFARDAGNFAGDEFVEYEIADHADGLARKTADDIEQTIEIDAGVG